MSGTATIFHAMPTGPDEASSDGVLEWANTISGSAVECAVLESHGWKPRFAVNDSDSEFVEIAFEKKFDNLDQADSEIFELKIGLCIDWEDDDE